MEEIPDSPPTPKPTIDTQSMVRELVNGLLSRTSMDESSRKLAAEVVHDYKNKFNIARLAMAAHKLARYHKILSAIGVGLEYLTDPDYIRALAVNPELLMKHMRLMVDIDREDRELFDTIVDGSKKPGVGGDVNTQLNLYFGEGTSTVLPDQMKDAHSRRRVQQLVGAIQEILSDREVPAPPQKSTRIIDAVPPKETGK